MLKRIIETSSRPGDLVLDCFAGSGTTLVAADELGRQWIGVDIGDEAIETIKERFKNGSKPMGDYVKKKKLSPMPMMSLFDNVVENECPTIITSLRRITYDVFVEV